MSYEHNYMTHQASKTLLQEIRSSQATWSNSLMSPATILWQGMADWPRPDIAFEDSAKDVALAFEFKPPNQPKREYITGLGQALTYLNDFTFSGLILPRVATDGFAIADYVSSMLTGFLSAMPIVLLSYEKDPTEYTVLRKLQQRKLAPVSIPKGVGGKVFWGYWRDLSNHDLLVLLGLLGTEASTFDEAFNMYWRKYAIRGRAKTWEGRKRKKKSGPPDSSEKLNAKLAMRHAGLVDSQGDITASGYQLFHIGRIYGPDSTAFLEELARQVLIAGRHLDLIFWVDEKQRIIAARNKRTAPKLYRCLDLQLGKDGIISPPPKTAAKQHFLRDEPKLWNKLRLLVPSSSYQYFHPGHGLVFDWRKIISILGGT
jgi:hypothetical protein